MSDPVTDSDSSSSGGSWVFVDENNPSNVNTPNQFYLNCLGEPVQELTENDLGVVDCDSDSDGISVISETEESLKESSSDYSTQEPFVADCICREINEQTTEKLESGINLKKLFITSSLIGAGVVVVAILIAPYITPKADDAGLEISKQKYHVRLRELDQNLHCNRQHKRKHFVSFNAEKIQNDSKKEIRNSENDYYKMKYSDDIREKNIVEREEDRDEVFHVSEKTKSRKRNKNDCDEDLRKREKLLRAKEEYLAKKEEYLIRKEYELLKKKVKLEKIFKGKRKLDGIWYTDLHKHRENLRKIEEKADWLFERARNRNRHRDKAQWYFQWMFGREEGRFRRPLRTHNA